MGALNNIELIRQLLKFEEGKSDLIYFIQILLRKKDGNILSQDGNNIDRCLKYYTVDSLEDYDKVAKSVVRHCEFEGARAYIHLNPRSKMTTMIRMIQDLSNSLVTKQYDNAKNCHTSMLGRYMAPDIHKTWIVDIDDKHISALDHFTIIINNVAPVTDSKIIATIPTKHGYHLITTPFDVATFRKLSAPDESVFKSPDIHKDNPTVLYIPESIMDNSEKIVKK